MYSKRKCGEKLNISETKNSITSMRPETKTLFQLFHDYECIMKKLKHYTLIIMKTRYEIDCHKDLKNVERNYTYPYDYKPNATCRALKLEILKIFMQLWNQSEVEKLEKNVKLCRNASAVEKKAR
jgi:hypothetical protein